MRIGPLKHRLAIQGQTETNTRGSVTRAWATVATRWGSVEPLAGREFMENMQAKGDTTHRVRIRWYDGLTSENRISWTVNGTERIFNIGSVLSIREKDREHVLMCKEVV